MTTSDTPTPRSYAAFVVFIAVLGAFSSLVNDMYMPAVPAMMRQFGSGPAVTQLGLALAMAGMGVGSVIWGSWSDSRGRKPVLLISMLLFVASTAVSILSKSIEFFIVCRFFQGLGAGGAMVLSTSIPADIYQGRRLAAVMAIVGAINGVAPAAGPLLGGFMADSIGWRGIFGVLLVIGIVMTVCTAKMRETLPVGRRASVRSLSDYLHAYRLLFANGRFMTYVCVKASGIALLYAYISSAPFVIQEHYGFSATSFGIIFGANAAAMAIGSAMAMKFKVMRNALAAGCAGMYAFGCGVAAVMYGSHAFLLYELTAVPMLFFGGMIFSSSNSLAMDVGRADAGTASAILSVVKYAFAAAVTPLVGIGNVLHASAWTFTAVALVTLILGCVTFRLRPLADMSKK